MTKFKDKARTIAYRKGGHSATASEINKWRDTTTELANLEHLDLQDVLVEHDTSRRQLFVALLARIQLPKENAPHVDIVLIPNVSHLGFDKSTQETTKERLENLGVTVIEIDKKNDSD